MSTAETEKPSYNNSLDDGNDGLNDRRYQPRNSVMDVFGVSLATDAEGAPAGPTKTKVGTTDEHKSEELELQPSRGTAMSSTGDKVLTLQPRVRPEESETVGPKYMRTWDAATRRDSRRSTATRGNNLTSSVELGPSSRKSLVVDAHNWSWTSGRPKIDHLPPQPRTPSHTASNTASRKASAKGGFANARIQLFAKQKLADESYKVSLGPMRGSSGVRKRLMQEVERKKMLDVATSPLARHSPKPSPKISRKGSQPQYSPTMDSLPEEVSEPEKFRLNKEEPAPSKPLWFSTAHIALYLCTLAVVVLLSAWKIPHSEHKDHGSYMTKYEAPVDRGLTAVPPSPGYVDIPVKISPLSTVTVKVVASRVPKATSADDVGDSPAYVGGSLHWKFFYRQEACKSDDCPPAKESELSGTTTLALSADKETEFLGNYDLEVDALGESAQAYFRLRTDGTVPVAAFFDVQQYGPAGRFRVVICTILLIAVYTLIAFEVVHQTLISLAGAFVALMLVTILAEEAPSLGTVFSWMDAGTLSLLFGMMILVAFLARTGVFEWIAVRMVQMSCVDNPDAAGKGEPPQLCRLFRLLIYICSFSAIVSAFMDNVTTLLLISPVTIRLSEMLAPKAPDSVAIPLLISNGIFGNIGGTMTLIGTIPNVIIGTRLKEYVGFTDFIVNMVPGVAIMSPFVILFMRWQFRKLLKQRYAVNIAEMKGIYVIQDWNLLIRAGVISAAVILLLFLHPVHHQDSGWIACVGALGLMIIGSPKNLQMTLEHVEWDTLLFFGGLFVMVEAIGHLGFIRAIGTLLGDLILAAPPESQLTTALMLIFWFSSFVSGFISNIAFAVTVVPILKALVETPGLDLPIKPLCWALSFGTCLGGNLTLVGSAANLVAAGVAEHHNMHISFMAFGRTGAPIWLLTSLIAALYIMTVYVWMGME